MQAQSEENGEDAHLEGRKILLVHAGSEGKQFILKRMKELGLHVVALHTDKPEWAIAYVDEWIIAQQNDTDAKVIERIKDYQQANYSSPLEGAVTFWEEEIPLHAHICEAMGFVGNSRQTSILTRSKFTMQETLRAAGCNAIGQKLVKSKADLDKAVETIGFPAIIKPLFGTDSICVLFIKDRAGAEEAYRHVAEHYKNPYEMLSTYDSDTFVYQEYIDGTEFSIECYSQHGVPHVVGMHEKTSMRLPFFMETGDVVPPRVSDEVRMQLENEAKAALIALGVRESLSHVEIKMSKRGPQVIEIASRMGGYYTHENVVRVYGFDMVDAACQIALGIEVTQKIRPPFACIISQFFIPEQSGVVSKLEGFDRYADDERVRIAMSKAVGDKVFVPPLGFESVGWACVRGKNLAEAEEVMRRVNDALIIEVRPFEPSELPSAA